MNCARKMSILRQSPRKRFSALTLLILLFTTVPVGAEEEFSFEIDEFEKKSLKWGGYAELKWEHMDINQGSAFTLLNLSDSSLSTLDRYTGSLQIDGRYDKGMSSLNWLLKAAAQQDDIGWQDTLIAAATCLNGKTIITGNVMGRVWE